MSLALDDLELLLGALQAATAEWRRRGPGKQPSPASQAAYLQTLLDTEAALLQLSPERANRLLIQAALGERLVQAAGEHAELGQLPWVTVEAWLRLLAVVLREVERQQHSLAHVVLRVWERVRAMGRDSYQRTYTGPAVCASLALMRLLMRHAPIELRDVVRKDLPHPIKNYCVPARAYGFQLAPYVIANMRQAGSGSKGTRVTGGPVLNADMHEYLRKGLTSDEYIVREAAVEAVRRTLELGVVLDTYTAPVLLDQLLAVSQDARLTSAKLEADAGVAMGHLLRLFQLDMLVGKTTNSVVAAPSSSETGAAAASAAPVEEGPWAYFGGATAPEAARLIRTLFRPAHMSRSFQSVLATSVATMLWLCCPSPATLKPALRAVFVLLVPVEGDSRSYMPALLADAIGQYARCLPSNSHRVELIACLCDYVRRIHEDRVIAHTALIAAEAVVPTLSSSRELSATLEPDMMAALKAQPGAFMGVVSTLAAHVALQSDQYRRRLLGQFLAASQRMMAEDGEQSAARGRVFSLELVFAVKAILAAHDAAPRHGDITVTDDAMSRDAENATLAVDFLGIAFAAPLLSLVIYLAATDAPRKLAPTTPPTSSPEAGTASGVDAHYQRAEYFFLLSTLLLKRYPHAVSAFMAEKLDLAGHQFAAMLVSYPATTAASLRAMRAACGFFLSTQKPTSSRELSLCIGFLEGLPQQQQQQQQQQTHAEPPALVKLRGDVYVVAVRSAPWATGGDQGSLRWLVTQALKEVEGLCRDGVPIAVPTEELFPAPTTAFMQPARRQVPTCSQMSRAEAARHAARLIARAVGEMPLTDMSFCMDVLRRVDRLVLAVGAALAASAPSRPTGAGVGPDGITTQLWSVMALLKAVLETAADSPPAARELWAKDYREFTQGWEKAVKQWCTVAASLDMRVLGAKVLGSLWCLSQGVDTYTTRTVVTQQPASSSAASAELISAAAVTSLPLAEAHTLYGRVHHTPATTLPMAVSFVTEVMKRCGPLGDPCSGPALIALLAYIQLLESYPQEARDAVANGAVHAFLVPDPPSLDPMVRSLLLVIFSLVPPRTLTASSTDAAATLPATEAGLETLRTACVRRAVAVHQRPALMPEVDAAELSLVGTMARHSVEHVAPSLVLVRRLLAHRIGEALSTAVTPTGAPTPPLSDSMSCALAALWHQGMNDEPSTDSVGILEAMRFIDMAATDRTRLAWRLVCQSILHHAVSVCASTTKPLLRVIKDLQAVLQARQPNLSDQHNTGINTEDAAFDKDNGAEADGEDNENMLAANKDDPHRRRGAHKHQPRGPLEKEETPYCAWSDVAAKAVALQLLRRAVDDGWSLTAPLSGPPSAGAAQCISASPVRVALMEVMVSAVPLVGTSPELLPDATDAVLAVLRTLGETKTPAAAVLTWKTTFVAAVRTVLELSVFASARVVELVSALLDGPLAEDTTMKRFTRTLFGLLATLDRLATERHPEMTSPQPAGNVCAALCRILASSAERPPPAASAEPTQAVKWPQTMAAATQGLRAPCGQAALVGMAARLVTAAALSTGFEPPKELVAMGTGGFPATAAADTEGEAATAGEVLRAVGLVCGGSGDGTSLGPGLRHAVGCLACTVLATDGADVSPLPALMPQLAATHQAVVVHLAHRSLVDEGPEPMSTTTEGALLAAIANATPSARTRGADLANELAASLLARGRAISVVDAGNLLCILLQSFSQQPPMGLLARVASLVSVDYICMCPSRLVDAARAFLTRAATPEERRAFFLQSPSAFLLGACASSGTSAGALSPLHAAHAPSPEASRMALAVFAEATDPTAVLSCLGVSKAITAPTLEALRQALRVPLRLTALLASCRDASTMVRRGPLLGQLLARILTATITAGAEVERAHGSLEAIGLAVRLMLEMLAAHAEEKTETDGSEFSEEALAMQLVLRPVGALLVQVVAKTHAQQVRGVIQSLPAEDVARLRRFMEGSATATPIHIRC